MYSIKENRCLHLSSEKKLIQLKKPASLLVRQLARMKSLNNKLKTKYRRVRPPVLLMIIQLHSNLTPPNNQFVCWVRYIRLCI